MALKFQGLPFYPYLCGSYLNHSIPHTDKHFPILHKLYLAPALVKAMLGTLWQTRKKTWTLLSITGARKSLRKNQEGSQG